MSDKIPSKFSEKPAGLPGNSKAVDAEGHAGSRGIPPKVAKAGNPSGTPVHSPITQGDKGIPPMNSDRSGKPAPLD